MRLASTLLLTLVPAALLTASLPAQTTTHHTATHHTATTSASTLPPNIPRIVGIAKPLYSLKYTDIKVGTGPLAEPSVLGESQATSRIMFYTVHYTGWLAKDGTKFDSSFDHPGAEPITFPYGLHRVIPGWDTGFEGMHVGGKRRLFVPWQLAYGEGGRLPVIPGKADLIFDIELVSVSDKPPAPKQPATPPPSSDPATKPETDPATNNPAKATTPDNAPKQSSHPESR